MQNVGTAKFTNLEGFLSWYQALSVEDARKLLERCAAVQNSADSVTTVLRDMLVPDSFFSNREQIWHDGKQRFGENLRKMATYCEAYDQPLFVTQWHEGLYAVLHTGNPEKCAIVFQPEEYLVFTHTPDYSGMTPAAVRASLGAGGGNSLLPAGAEFLTQRDVREKLGIQMNELSGLKQEMDDVENARTSELAEIKKKMEELRTELEAKKQEMMAELAKKKAEIERIKEQMEGQIYLLDSQIYAIRCYAGEVVKFTKIRSGRNAPDTETIVIHQKLRFLDEDLGRLASLYEIQWDELSLFEDFLKHSPAALDTFAPNERCVVLVRLSKTGKQQGRDDRLPYSNLITDFEYFHGKTVGIIIRNGENLYLGWTDEDRVHINDDLIISQVIEDTSTVPEFRFESERTAWEKNQKAERKRILDGLISRTFIYNILQGVVDNSSILPLPEGVKLNKQSQYVAYSVADKWLADTRFGSFNDIVEKCNSRITKGDMLLSVQYLIPETAHGRNYSAWENPRGRGDKNRTHDCHVSDCTIYPVNLIEFDEPVTMLRYEYNHGCVDTIRKKYGKNLIGCKILEEFEERTRHIYVSVEKTESGFWSRTPARANFEVYEREIINLTYMNSVWLEWVITNKTLGGWTINGHPVDYAYAIRYLKTALDFVRKREAQEKELLDAVDVSICKGPDWPLRLSEWKLEKGVRNLTEYQAKRFVAAMKKEG